MSEQEIIEYFRARAAENSCGYTSFLGAGVYNHLRSVVTDSLIQRGEFLTSYTPYQAEISQGTLQAIFEFQTLMCQLTGMEVANASMWDGSTATTEAVLMAERLTGRHRVVVARSLHPEYRQVLETYTRNLGLRIDEIGFTRTGQVDANRAGRRDQRRNRRGGRAVAEFFWRPRTDCRSSRDARARERRAARRRHHRRRVARRRAASRRGGHRGDGRRRASACRRATAARTPE